VTGILASDRYSHEKLKHHLAKLDYDVVIIDTPPSLCWLTESALIAADNSLVCATPEFFSVKGLQRLSYFLHYIAERHPLETLGVVLSFWSERGMSNVAFLEAIESSFPDKLFSTRIRRDITVSRAAIHGTSVYDAAPRSRASEDFAALTKEIVSRLGENKNHPQSSKREFVHN